MRTCAACGRTLGKVARRCLYCGTPAEGIEDAPVVGKPVVVSCPGCVRKLRLPPDTIGSCSYCALALILDEAANVRLGPAPGVAPAASDEVTAATADLPRARLWDLVGRVLSARAQLGELGEGEAGHAVRALEAIASWPPDRELWLPVPLDELASIASRCVFGVSDGAVYRDEGTPVLRIGLGSKPRASLKADWVAREAIGLATSLALGAPFGLRPEDTTETAVRLWFVISVEPRDGGVELLDLAYQVDEGAPTPAGASARADVVARIAASRSLLASYYILGALFGPSCRGGTVFGLTRDGIAGRLAALGCPTPDDLVDRLHVRMPAAFGWPA